MAKLGFVAERGRERHSLDRNGKVQSGGHEAADVVRHILGVGQDQIGEHQRVHQGAPKTLAGGFMAILRMADLNEVMDEQREPDAIRPQVSL